VKRAKPIAPGAGLAAWGWYAVVGITDGKIIHGGDVPGGDAAKVVRSALAKRADTTRGAFWAAWWSEDPRQKPETPPDDFGVVLGAQAHAEAIGEADRIIRIARGRPVFARSVGDLFARRAFREGGRRKTTATEKHRRAALEALTVTFGLNPETATVADVRRAFRRVVKTSKVHPDQGGTAAAFDALVQTRKAVEDFVRVLEQDRDAGATARGDTVVRKSRKRSR
jgi:hypothetical protein